MNDVATIAPERLASALNAACQCMWIDRERLRRQLEQQLGDDGRLLDSRPGLVSGSVVFLDRRQAESMDRTVALVHQVLSSPVCLRETSSHADPIARLPRDAAGTLLALDFHLGREFPQLIEVNTNPGGLLIGLALARAVTAACDCLAEPLAGLASAGVTLEELAAAVTRGFLAEWVAVRGTTPLRSIAIVDDDPPNQYLYPEFLLYQRLFEMSGWPTRIRDAAALEFRAGALEADGERIDLVYNRLTDFYFAEPRHVALRQAYEAGSTVVTPHPAAHARWADKRLLALLRDEPLLEAAGLDAGARDHLLHTIPATEIVEPHAADDLWRRRKQLFFKPIDGYGSKAAYLGAKLTRATFDRILTRRYVAQAVAPTSSRRVTIDGQDSDLRVDIRNYGARGATWLRAARLYRGQTTNFRTAGGGFAPVLTLAR